MSESSSEKDSEEIDLFLDLNFGADPTDDVQDYSLNSNILSEETAKGVVIKRANKSSDPEPASDFDSVKIYRGKGAVPVKNKEKEEATKIEVGTKDDRYQPQGGGDFSDEDVSNLVEHREVEATEPKIVFSSPQIHEPSVLTNQSDEINLGMDHESFAEFPIGMVLEPVYRDKSKVSIIKILAGFGLVGAVVIFSFVWKGKDKNKSDYSSAEYTLVPKLPVSEEDPLQSENRARDTLTKFFSIKRESELMGMIRRPNRVGELVEDFYSRNVFSMPQLKSVDSVTRFDNVALNFWMANVTVQDELQARTIILEDTERGFLVDWEEYVRYSPMNWEKFIRSRHSGAINFRVRATLDINPGFAFPEQSEWVCVRISDWKSDTELFGYVPVGTELAKRISDLLFDEWQKDCVLKLQFPDDRSGGNRQVRILALINDCWVNFD